MSKPPIAEYMQHDAGLDKINENKPLTPYVLDHF